MKQTMRRPCGLYGILLLVFLITVPVGPAEGQGGTYVIGEGDVLEVTVWKNPELSRTVTVRPDGMISLPLANDLKVSGLKPEQVSLIIKAKLAGFVNDPNVSVSVSQATSYRVYTLGAVANGMFQLSAPVTAVQLLALAGGPSPEADISRAVVIRGDERLPLDLVQQLQGQEGAGQALSPGDILMIPVRQVDKVDVDRVLVVGEVNSPRGIPFKDGMTVLDAFVEAGSGTEFANLKKTTVVRREKEGQKKEILVRLDKVMEDGDLKYNITLLPGDIVVVH